MQTAREIAKQWRANPGDRLSIEREIAVSGRQGEFSRNRDGELIAKVTQADRDRCSGASVRLYPTASVGFREIGFTKLVAHPIHGFAVVDAELAA